MITPTTRAAIAVLKDIYACTHENCTDLSPETLEEVMGKLQKGGLICLVDKKDPQLITSYHPAVEIKEISLLGILEATEEHLDCNHPNTEEFYMQYGRAAPKLGVVNHMTRLYLKEIKLFDL